MLGKTGGARFTGASDSLKVVSGASARGMAEAQTAAANKIRTDIQRSRFTLNTPPKARGYNDSEGLSMIMKGDNDRRFRAMGG